MNGSKVMLACVALAQLSFAHAGDSSSNTLKNGSEIASNVSPGEPDDTKSISFMPGEAEAPKGISMLLGNSVQRGAFADQGTGLHPTLTNDPMQFQQLLPQNQSMVHVDLSSVSGQTAPLFVEGNNFVVGIYGDAQALNSQEGMPASNWFGDSSDSTFVLANRSVQIVFPEDVQATSLLTSTGETNKLSPSDDRGIPALFVVVLDANGGMISGKLISPSTDSPKTLEIPSAIPFRSVIISSTSEKWMFSNLEYDAEASVAK